jgi:hypothetical protein
MGSWLDYVPPQLYAADGSTVSGMRNFSPAATTSAGVVGGVLVLGPSAVEGMYARRAGTASTLSNSTALRTVASYVCPAGDLVVGDIILLETHATLTRGAGAQTLRYQPFLGAAPIHSLELAGTVSTVNYFFAQTWCRVTSATQLMVLSIAELQPQSSSAGSRIVSADTAVTVVLGTALTFTTQINMTVAAAADTMRHGWGQALRYRVGGGP